MFKAALACVMVMLLQQTAAEPEEGMRVKLQEPGTFYSPTITGNFTDGLIFSWELQAEHGMQISLQFTQFAIEKSTNCSKNAVIIYEGDQLMTRFCGTDVLPAYKSKRNNLIVVWKIYTESYKQGFEANWTTKCGGEYNATAEEQYIISPGNPNYSPNMFCRYDIYAPKGQKVLIKYLNFDLFVSDTDCADSLNLDTYAFGYGGVPISVKKANYCGDDNPQNDFFEDHLTIYFSSNDKNEKTGFKIGFLFLSECGGRITEPTFISPSPFPRYQAGTSCIWTIEAPKDKVVKLKFHYVSLNQAPFCGKDGDFIAIYDGLEIDSDKRLAANCGWFHSEVVVPSTGNTMTVHFKSKQEGRGFLAEVFFMYPESEGCGGNIDMTSQNSKILIPPSIVMYGRKDFLDCQWNVLAPEGKVIRMKLDNIYFQKCLNLMTFSRDRKCFCNFMEIMDGSVPDSLVMRSYCDNSLLQDTVSSSNTMGIRLLSGVLPVYQAQLTVEEPLCKPTVIQVSHRVQRFTSPGYESGSIARGLHCGYKIESNSPILDIRLLIKKLDIQSSTTPGVCDNDKLIIGKRSEDKSIGRDYKMHNWPIVSNYGNSMFNEHNIYANVNHTHQYELCGSHEYVEFYLEGSFYLNLITAPQSNGKNYRGIEFEVSFAIYCDRNYTEPYGRIQATTVNQFSSDCYTLITAPENRTISVYFISYPPYLKNPDTAYHDIYDGNTMEANKLISTKGRKLSVGSVIEPVFSTGKYMLIHSIRSKDGKATYDLNYVTTDKGRGCGGYLYSDQGVVTSPFYPNAFKENKTCEWILETPVTTRLHLKFSDFHVFSLCDKAKVQLINRNDEVIETYCNTQWTKELISEDNYVKIVFSTTDQTNGAGWVALFAAVASN